MMFYPLMKISQTLYYAFSIFVRSSVDSAHKQKTETSINNGHRVEKTKKLSKVLDALHQMNKQLLRMDCAQHNH